MSSSVALLRNLNLGPTTQLSMADLRRLVEEAGYEHVTTYIRSGNVVFDSGSSGGAAIAKALEQRLSDAGLRTKVIVRTAKEMAAVVKSNPFVKSGAELSKLHVMFLASKPAAAAVKSLDPHRSAGDEFVVHGREIYLHLPNGVGRSKLSVDYFEKRLDTAATGRNWNTVTKLANLAAAL
jgi:uncharacterized protein (DUF1697 family)